eukprot:832597-Amphidinium_carterae.3
MGQEGKRIFKQTLRRGRDCVFIVGSHVTCGPKRRNGPPNDSPSPTHTQHSPPCPGMHVYAHT